MTIKKHGPMVMGIYLGHDQGCSIMHDGKIICAIEEERLNRYKHSRPRLLGGLWQQFAGKFGYFPWASVSYCLRVAGSEMTDIDLIAIGDDQWAKDAKGTIQELIPILDKSKVLYIDQPKDACHHFHHALSSFYLSTYSEAAVLIIDGDGNLNINGYEAETGFLMNRNGGWDEVFKNRYKERELPRSGIGWMYEQVSYLLGFGNHEIGLAQPGKTMGLAPYGGPTKTLYEPWIIPDGFNLDFSGFKHWMVQSGYDQQIFGTDPGIVTRLEEPLKIASEIAYKVQKETEIAIISIAKALQEKTGATKLCLGGGVALNSVANGKLLKEQIFDSVNIIPCVHDGGQSIGLALHGHLLLTNSNFNSGMGDKLSLKKQIKSQSITPIESPYLGKNYENIEILKSLNEFELPFECLSEQEVMESSSTSLANGKIIGWFQGASEIGPRALGNRSILASPTFANMKDKLNSRVKFREGFRPFAPSVLAEYCANIFDFDKESPYMLVVAKVKKDWREKIPAVVHVDQSARLQTVSKDMNPKFHRLIEALSAKTGVPIVLNTSFNLAGMPIVESPEDAINCFVQTQLDELYIGNFRLKSLDLGRLVYKMKPGWRVSTTTIGKNKNESIKISAPNGKFKLLECDLPIRHALRLLDGETSLREIMPRIGLSDSEYNEFDSMMKHLIRFGCVELLLGKRIISNKTNDISWDNLLYQTVNREVYA